MAVEYVSEELRTPSTVYKLVIVTPLVLVHWVFVVVLGGGVVVGDTTPNGVLGDVDVPEGKVDGELPEPLQVA